MPHAPDRHPHLGAGSLAVLLMLFTGAALLMLLLNRAQLIELRASTHALRAAQAHEAAEAGLAWALALLNHPGHLGADCLPLAPNADAATGQRFIDRYLRSDERGRLTPVAGARAACVADAGQWRCSCPDGGADGRASLAGGSVDEGQRPAFALQFAAGPRPGTLRLSVDGCNHQGAPCASGAAADATIRSEQLLATLGALARPPYAALTSLGPVQLQGSVELLHTTAPGFTASSAGDISLEAGVSLVAAPGQEPESSLLASDPTWRTPAAAGSSTAAAAGGPISAAHLFRTHFALDRSSYRALPVVKTLACAGGCADADVRSAYAGGARLLWVEGPLTLAAADSYGSADQPLLLIVSGTLSITAPVSLHGLVYAGAVQWRGDGAALGQLHGALVSEGDTRLSGRVRLRHDAGLLARLQFGSGLFAPVPGGWRDFGS